MDAIFSTAGTAEKEGEALLALGRLPIGVTELAISYSDVKGPSITPNAKRKTRLFVSEVSTLLLRRVRRRAA